MAGLLVLLWLLPSVLASTIRTSSYSAVNYLQDFQDYTESYAMPNAIDGQVQKFRYMIFVRNMQKIDAFNSKRSSLVGSYSMKSNRYTMFRYDEFEASIAFSNEVQFPEFNLYSVNGVDHTEGIKNPRSSSKIDINRGLRCYMDLILNKTICEQKNRFVSDGSLWWNYQKKPIISCLYKVTNFIRKTKSKMFNTYLPTCKQQNSLPQCFEKMHALSSQQIFYAPTCQSESDLHFYGQSSYPDYTRTNSLSSTIYSLDTYAVDLKGEEVSLSEQQILDCTDYNNRDLSIQERIESTLDSLMTDGLTTDENYPSIERRIGQCQIKGGPYRLSGYSVIDNCEAIDQFLQSGKVSRFSPDLYSDLILSTSQYGDASLISSDQSSTNDNSSNKTVPSSGYRVLAPIKLDPSWQFYGGGLLPPQEVGIGFNYVVTLTASNSQYWTVKSSLEIGDGNLKEIKIAKGPARRRAYSSNIGSNDMGNIFLEDGVCQQAYAIN